jgi:hypothetical protein
MKRRDRAIIDIRVTPERKTPHAIAVMKEASRSCEVSLELGNHISPRARNIVTVIRCFLRYWTFKA